MKNDVSEFFIKKEKRNCYSGIGMRFEEILQTLRSLVEFGRLRRLQ